MHQKQSSISQLPAHAMHESTRNLMGRRWQAAEMPKWTWHHQTQKRSSSIEQTRMKPKWLQIPKSTPKVYPLPPNTNNIWVGVGSAPFDPTLTLPRGPTQTHLKRRRPDPTRPTRPDRPDPTRPDLPLIQNGHWPSGYHPVFIDHHNHSRTLWGWGGVDSCCLQHGLNSGLC